MKRPVRVAVTGAAGQIGYSALFRIADGAMLGTDQPLTLQLLEIPQAQDVLRGVEMELRDCAFPLLHDIVCTDRPEEAFDGAEYVLLVGAKPRGPGMERKDLLTANAQIFAAQGKALSGHADRAVRVLVVGNPANTNALIAASNADALDPRQFTAMTRLDHNRALAQLALYTGKHITTMRRMTVWGNHSTTQYPDISHCTVDGWPAPDCVDQAWYRETFIPTVQQRGAAVIEARGASSAASAAAAAIDHMHDWVLGSADGDWVSMAVSSDGSYGIEPGVVYSYPVVCRGGDYEIVQDLTVDDFSRDMMSRTEAELREERDAVKDLL